jgi:hypothetical protein
LLQQFCKVQKEDYARLLILHSITGSQERQAKKNAIRAQMLFSQEGRKNKGVERQAACA